MRLKVSHGRGREWGAALTSTHTSSGPGIQTNSHLLPHEENNKKDKGYIRRKKIADKGLRSQTILFKSFAVKGTENGIVAGKTYDEVRGRIF